jgi:hypothetical protein
MARPLLLSTIFLAAVHPGCCLQSQQPLPPTAPAATSSTETPAPLPDIRTLVLDVERNQKAAEALTRDYTYHVHIERQDLAKDGAVRKTVTTDSESVTLSGVRVNRIVARDGKPLTPDEIVKENERIDKEVADSHERRAKEEGKGKETDSRGNVVLTASRILELGTFSNPRRVDLNGRPTIVLDYTGDPNAQTHGPAEGVFRDLVGTVWVDEQDRVLIRGQGHFVNDYKIAGGLVANIHKGMNFTFESRRVADNVWIPSVFSGKGSARLLLFDSINGNFSLVTSDYRKFRTGVTIIPTDRVIGPDGQPVADSTAAPQPTTTASEQTTYPALTPQ